jgi:hypothetical protein
MLDLMAVVKVNVSPHPTAQNNAAKVFSEDSRCKLKGKAGRPKLKAAMERLLAKGMIEVAETGPQSRRTPYLCRVERGVVVDFPSGKPASEQPQGNGSEPGTASPQSDGGGIPAFIPASQKEELKRRGFTDDDVFEMKPERARDILADPNRTAASERYRVVGDAPAGSACSLCFGIDGSVKMVEDTERGGKAEPLHPDHAKEFFETEEPEPPL